jgi:ABC-type polysaccharide/polyol phosphate transport system ATPase subunit
MNTTMISVENVTMRFNLSKDRIIGLKEYVIKALKRQLFYEEFYALKNVTFKVKKGEVFGIIGLNGAGKSTLLKIVAGVFKPTEGNVKVYGGIVPLLELGAGFDYEFSARENIYMNGAMFGHSPAYMADRYNEILDFAELWEFEDVAVKNFSSGMIARLGFAIATCIQPEILIVDEILGVGDYRFREKCKKRIDSMIESGTTVLLVSHNIEDVKKMCKRAILLQRGEVVAMGDVNEVAKKYGEI